MQIHSDDGGAINLILEMLLNSAWGEMNITTSANCLGILLLEG